MGFQPAPVAEDTGLDAVTWSCCLYMVSRVRIERFPVSKYCTWLIYVEEIGMVETWFTALVALESNSPSQERAWLLKKREREIRQLNSLKNQSGREIVVGWDKAKGTHFRGPSRVMHSFSKS